MKMEQEFNFGGFRASVSDDDRDLFAKETKHPEKILSAKKLDAPLKPISQRSPVFPSSVPEGLNHGSAKVEILIDEEGKVHLPRIAEASYPAFGYAAVQAVIDWRFEPPKAGGEPAIVRVQVPFEFKQEIKNAKAIKAPTLDQATIDSIVPQEKQP
jgi:TonB family protein